MSGERGIGKWGTGIGVVGEPLISVKLISGSLVHFIIDAIEQIGVTGFKVNRRGTGNEQYPPEMMPTLLVYSYVTGRFGPRAIEAATYTDVALRYICGDEAHPDHSVICAFRKDNKEAFEETFTKILLLARRMKKLKRTGNVSAGGSKFLVFCPKQVWTKEDGYDTFDK